MVQILISQVRIRIVLIVVNSDCATIIHLVVITGNIEMLGILLSNFNEALDINVTDKEGVTPLMLAATSGNEKMFKVC